MLKEVTFHTDDRIEIEGKYYFHRKSRGKKLNLQIALEKGNVKEIAKRHGVHPNTIRNYRRILQKSS